MGVEPKIGVNNPKMDGENNGKPYFLMDDLGVPLFLETPISLLRPCISSFFIGTWHQRGSDSDDAMRSFLGNCLRQLLSASTESMPRKIRWISKNGLMNREYIHI